MGKRARSRRGVEIRDMCVEDIAPVFHLGEKVFDVRRLPTMHRTWDPYEVAYLFVSEGDLSLVATEKGRLVGFCLGTTVDKPQAPAPFGYLIWLGVEDKARRRGVAGRLMAAMARRMRECGVKLILLDTEESNTAAIDFFRRVGFQTTSRRQVWMWRGLDRRAGKRPPL